MTLIENLFLVWRNLQTDTASVLTEAIGYIQFLHDQIEVIFVFQTSSLLFQLFSLNLMFQHNAKEMGGQQK